MSRRLREMRVALDFVVGMSKTDKPFTVKVTENRLPSDAEIQEVIYNKHTGEIGVVLKSEEFPELIEGEGIPILKPPVFRSLP